MSGMASDRASTDEASDPIQPDVGLPDTLANRTPESASSARERVARQFEPGENQSITRRLSDTVGSMRHQFQESEASEQNKSMLDRSHEMLAKALGGGSRGAS